LLYNGKITHSIHAPISAKFFIEPIVIKLIDCGFESKMWLEQWEKYLAIVDSIQVPKKVISSDLTFNPLKFITRLQAYRSAIRATRPSIIHTHQSRSSLIPLLAAYIERVPFRIYHNHGLPYLGYQGIMRWLLRSLEMVNINLATQVLLVSHSNLQAAREDGLLDKDRGKVIGSGSICGIDLTQYTIDKFDRDAQILARKKLKIDRHSFVLAYVGRPFKRKGFNRLLTAWQESKLGEQGNILLMAGCSNSDIISAVGTTVVGVRGLGHVDDMLGFYAACDAAILPSEHEGFPYGMLEAAAAGKPLIGTDIPGIRCAIKHERTGLLIPVNDPNALKEAILKIAANPDLRMELGQNARKRVEAEFDRETVLNEFLSFYDSLLKNNGSSIVSQGKCTGLLTKCRDRNRSRLNS
jgi:N,N'-diacetylbacillosaminyl-diphospho-undecaprenol alpha-1,3-N-acetylgalactosaminyltransferase